MSERVFAEVFPPGEFLRDELEARGWTQTEFAEIIGRPPRVVNEIIAGKRGITPETAKELAAALGTSAQMWMNLETSYQLFKAQPASDHIARKAKLREKFPIRDMIRRGWITASDDQEVLEGNLCRFFGLASAEHSIQFPHAARRNYQSTMSIIQWAWLFRVKQLAESVPAKPYSKDLLRASIEKLLALLSEPEEIRHVPRLLASCGVRFVAVETVPGSKISGVCFWVDGNRSPVIGMSLLHDRIDNFWFVLRHEIEHILEGHGKNDVIIDELAASGQSGADVSVEEKVANDAAEEFCVARRDMDDFVARTRPFFSEEKIVRFAKRIRRHPGIVIGQLQNRLGRHDLLKKYQVKIRPYVTSSALTDGWGQTAPV